MRSYIMPGDYISYLMDSKIEYGIVLETPECSYIRQQRLISQQLYLIRSDKEHNYPWCAYANHFADKNHFCHSLENNILSIEVPKTNHAFKLGDRVYNTKCKSTGIVRKVPDRVKHNPMFAHVLSIEMDWDLSKEPWFKDFDITMHCCNGSVPGGNGLYCFEEDLIWIPNEKPVLERIPIIKTENPLYAIFRMCAKDKKDKKEEQGGTSWTKRIWF